MIGGCTCLYSYSEICALHDFCVACKPRILDTDIVDAIRLAIPDATGKSNPFVREQSVTSATHILGNTATVLTLGAAEDAMLEANFAMLKEEIQMDQTERTSLQNSAQAWEGRSCSALVKIHEMQHDLMFNKVEELCEVRFPMVMQKMKR